MVWAPFIKGSKTEGGARGRGLQSGDSTELGADAQKQMEGGSLAPRKALLGCMHCTLQAPSRLPQPPPQGRCRPQAGGPRSFAHSSLGKK